VPPTAPAHAASGSHARRVIFIDLARALAVVFMLYGHTIDALLAPAYRTGVWFDVWLFQRGLTSSLFLLLSGFAFSVATGRHWASHTAWSPAVFKRVRRFAMFVLLGYALHFPAARFVDMPKATDEQWRIFLSSDVLQLIGITFIGVQLLVLLTRSRLVFTVAGLALSAAIVVAAPFMWAVDWTAWLPLGLAAYLMPILGTQLPLFPLFPWSAFVLGGASLGQIYARWGSANLTRFTWAALLAPGVALLGLNLVLRMPRVAAWWSGPGASIPVEVTMRVGTCLLILAVIAFASRRVTSLPHVFSAVAQETLVIYFVHLCLVYGSVWGQGLWQIYGPTLDPLQTFKFVVVLIASMVALAWWWNWLKHARPRAARWVAIVVVALLFGRLL
jgi:uncharacterized membrane protein